MRPPFFDPSKVEHASVYESVKRAQVFLTGRVLDLGSGEQPFAPVVKASTAQYFGIDVTVSDDKKPDVCGDSLSLPFKDCAFDAILCTQVLEHVRGPFVLFQEVVRVLKDNGFLIMTAPQAWPLHEEPYDFFRYTKYGLAELAESNGLKVIKLEERGGGIAAIGQLTAAVLYDTLGNRRITRVPMKIALAPMLSLCRVLDKIFYYPKFTLGYLLVAQKTK